MSGRVIVVGINFTPSPGNNRSFNYCVVPIDGRTACNVRVKPEPGSIVGNFRETLSLLSYARAVNA